MKTRANVSSGTKSTKRKRTSEELSNKNNNSAKVIIPNPTFERKKKKSTGEDHFKNVSAFLQKTYTLFDGCDPAIAGWSKNCDMIEVRDQELFAEEWLPKFFGTSTFASFARQLNFYGFRKIPTMQLRKSGSQNGSKSKTITFQNPLFKKDQPELLKKILRSTNTTNKNNIFQQQEELDNLKNKLGQLESLLTNVYQEFNNKLAQMQDHFEKRFAELVEPNRIESFGEGILNEELRPEPLNPLQLAPPPVRDSNLESTLPGDLDDDWSFINFDDLDE